MSEELVAALINAIERGYTLQQAKQSLLNAGYSQKDIESAALQMNIHSDSYVQANKIVKPAIPEISEIEKGGAVLAVKPVSNTPNQQNLQRPRRKIWKIIMLVLILLIFLGLAGYIIVFWSSIVELLNNT